MPLHSSSQGPTNFSFIFIRNIDCNWRLAWLGEITHKETLDPPFWAFPLIRQLLTSESGILEALPTKRWDNSNFKL